MSTTLAASEAQWAINRLLFDDRCPSRLYERRVSTFTCAHSRSASLMGVGVHVAGGGTMRVRARPPRSTSEIDLDLPSLPHGEAPEVDQPSGLAAQREGAPELPTTRSPVRILIILLAI